MQILLTGLHYQLHSVFQQVIDATTQHPINNLDADYLYRLLDVDSDPSANQATAEVAKLMHHLQVLTNSWATIFKILRDEETEHDHYDNNNLAAYYRSLLRICRINKLSINVCSR